MISHVTYGEGLIQLENPKLFQVGFSSEMDRKLKMGVKTSTTQVQLD